MQAIRDSDLGSYSRLHRVAHIDNGRAARRLHVTDIGNAVVDGNLTAATAIEPGEFANALANRHGLPFDPPHDFEFFRSSSLKTSRQAVTPLIAAATPTYGTSCIMISTSSSRKTPQRNAPWICVRSCGAAVPRVARAATVTIWRVLESSTGD